MLGNVLAQQIDTFTVVRLQFSNDIFNQTDRYYTNGLLFGFGNKKIGSKIKIQSNSLYQFGEISIFQDLYTPSVYNTNRYDPNDRPYAGVLAINYTINSLLNNHHLVSYKLTSGIIGKYALGEQVQNGLHEVIENLDALGWAYQIENGLLINASYQRRFPLIYDKEVEPIKTLIQAIGEANLGTYKTNLKLGLCINIGSTLLNPEPNTYLWLEPKKNKKFDYSFGANSTINFIGHDATLQGALISQDNFGLSANQIRRITLNSSFYFSVRYKLVFFSIHQNVVSPEFNGGLWHKWVSINLARFF